MIRLLCRYDIVTQWKHFAEMLPMSNIKMKEIQSTLDTSNFKGLGKICRVISSSR